MKFVCIADEDTARGFRLAGVATVATLEAATANPECGIVIITEEVAAGMREQVDRFRLEHDRPLIVEIPGPAGSLAGRKGLRRLVQQAVGINVGGT